MKLWSAQQDFTVPQELLPEHWNARLDEQVLKLIFPSAQPMISSAVMNGGYQQAKGWINLRVPPKCIVGVVSPESVFQSYLSDDEENFAGMMTAASMKSCRIAAATVNDSHGQQAKLVVLLTSGLGNLRCAGDRAEYRELYAVPEKVGTINMLLACDKPLAPAAMTEALMIATEAKVAALMDLQLMSPVSNNIATGTGTDAVAFTSPAPVNNKPVIEFVGKHTVMGETLAQLVIDALKDSICAKGSLFAEGSLSAEGSTHAKTTAK